MTEPRRVSVRSFISLRQILCVEALAQEIGFDEYALHRLCRDQFHAALPALLKEETRELIAELEGYAALLAERVEAA